MSVDLQFCQGLPKVELHAHLTGSLSKETVVRLGEAKAARVPGYEYQTSASVQQLHIDNIFALFPIIQEVTDCVEAVTQATKSVIAEFAADNVKYLELRSTPRHNPATNMTKLDYLKAMGNGIKSCGELDIYVTMIVSIDRRQHSSQDAMDHVNLALLARDIHGLPVVGMDLSGNPKCQTAAIYAEALSYAQKHGLKVSAHLAEISEARKELADFFAVLRPDRIGHGTYIYPEGEGDSECQQNFHFVRQHNIPLELCLTSNIKSKTVKSYEDHHFGSWRSCNHPIILCTDDKGMLDTSLSQEYLLAAKHFGLSKLNLYEISEAGLEHCWATPNTATALRKQWTEFKVNLNLV